MWFTQQRRRFDEQRKYGCLRQAWVQHTPWKCRKWQASWCTPRQNWLNQNQDVYYVSPHHPRELSQIEDKRKICSGLQVLLSPSATKECKHQNNRNEFKKSTVMGPQAVHRQFKSNKNQSPSLTPLSMSMRNVLKSNTLFGNVCLSALLLWVFACSSRSFR